MKTIQKQEDNILSNLVHYYEVRMGALSEYSDRVWQRFNWFLTLHLAIFGLLFTQVDKLSSQPLLKSGIPFVGITVAFLWALMGIEDYVSMRKHGKRTTEIERKLKEVFLNKGFCFEVAVRKSFVKFRQTWLLFLFPIFVATVWIFIVIN